MVDFKYSTVPSTGELNAGFQNHQQYQKQTTQTHFKQITRTRPDFFKTRCFFLEHLPPFGQTWMPTNPFTQQHPCSREAFQKVDGEDRPDTLGDNPWQTFPAMLFSPNFRDQGLKTERNTSSSVFRVITKQIIFQGYIFLRFLRGVSIFFRLHFLYSFRFLLGFGWWFWWWLKLPNLPRQIEKSVTVTILASPIPSSSRFGMSLMGTKPRPCKWWKKASSYTFCFGVHTVTYMNGWLVDFYGKWR